MVTVGERFGILRATKRSLALVGAMLLLMLKIQRKLPSGHHGMYGATTVSHDD
jgi:hypothetical protein